MTESDISLAPPSATSQDRLPFRLSLGIVLAFVIAPLTGNFALLGKVLVGDVAVLLAICLLCLRVNLLLVRFDLRTFRQIPPLRWITALALLGTASATLAYSYGPTDVFARLRIVAFLALSFAVLFRASNPLFAKRVLTTYLALALVASVVVIVQVVWFRVTGGILAPDLSAIEVEPNSVFQAAKVNGEFRTGGLFREPSWFIVFVAPACFWFLRARSMLRSAIVTIGILLSTSSLGLVVLLLEVVEAFVLRGKKKLRNGVIVVILAVLGAAAVTRIVPASTERAAANLNGEGSITIRLFSPLLLVSNPADWSFLGVNTSWMRGDSDNSEDNWLDSAVYAVVLLGIPWAILFYAALFKIAGPAGGIVLFTLILFEGCIGRPDFWAAFAAFGIMRLLSSKVALRSAVDSGRTHAVLSAVTST